MNEPRRYRAAIAAIVLVLAACAAQSGGASPDESVDETPPPFSAVPSSSALSVPPGGIGEVPADLMTQIVADASERAGVPEGDVKVIEAVAVTWNDGSLGCPEPGQMYTQALVDGYHVIVVAGDERLDYRAGGGGGFRLCELPGAGGGGGSGND